MAKKNDQQQEDILSSDERALEERVDELMDVERVQKPATNKIAVTHFDDTEEGTEHALSAATEVPRSAPPVKSAKGQKKTIDVAVHDDTIAAEVPKTSSDELAATIAQVNEALVQEKPGPPPLAPDEEVDALSTDDGVESANVADGSDEQALEDETVQDKPDTDELEPSSDPTAPTPSDTLDEPETNNAVDEIIAEESDTLLDIEDTRVAEAAEAVKPPKRSLISRWWHSRLARGLTVGVILLLVAAAAILPTTRYAVLNACGVRSSASVQIIDESTFQPLKNVEVRIADQTTQTDADGRASLTHLKLGSTQLVVQKRAFAPINKAVVIGWGSNPLGGFNLTPVGSQYSFNITDYVSGKPIAKVQAVAGDANAQSDEKGALKLTLDHASAAAVIEVVIAAPGYREERVKIDQGNKVVTNVALVPAQKEVFVSKRTGKYDVYAIDIDTKNEKKLLAGTGNEQENMVLLPSGDGQVVALVSTRDNVRNSDGFLKSTLTVISVADGAAKTVTQSEQINLVGWSGSRLVYVQIATGTSAANPSRVRLMSYDYKSADNHQLAATNYFNDVMLVDGKIYYAPSSTYQAAGVAVNLFSINPDGSNKQTILAEETWNAFRVSYDRIVLSIAGQKWYEFKPGGTPVKLEGAPGNLKSRAYFDSPDGKRSLWVDTRDGKGVLLSYDTNTKTDTVLQTKSGLTLPARWLNNSSFVYRVDNEQESADYVMSINGGSPRKITDVSNTGGVDGWYYY